MLKIPGGECTIKDTISHEADHKPVIEPFLLAKFPVTNEEYKRFIDATGYAAPETNTFGSKYRLWSGRTYPPEIARQPVVNVSWNDANAYCAWLSKSSGKTYKLPTEEQWEFAARGGLKSKPYPWGDKADKTLARYGQKWNGTKTLRDVDFGKPNDYGLYGMSGNVWQWVENWYVPVYNGRPVPEELQLYRVLRGGSWVNEETFATVGYRNFNPPDARDVFAGFRVAGVIQ